MVCVRPDRLGRAVWITYHLLYGCLQHTNRWFDCNDNLLVCRYLNWLMFVSQHYLLACFLSSPPPAHLGFRWFSVFCDRFGCVGFSAPFTLSKLLSNSIFEAIINHVMNGSSTSSVPSYFIVRGLSSPGMLDSAAPPAPSFRCKSF